MNTTLEMSDSRKASRNFLTRLVMGVALLNLIALALAASSLYQGRKQYHDRAVTTTQNLTRVLEQTISGNIRRIDLALLTVADEIERQGGDPERLDAKAISAYLARQHARLPETSSLRVTNARGDVVLGTQVTKAARAWVADRDYFLRLRDNAGAGLVISKPLVGRVSNKRGIVLARRLNGRDGSFEGIVYAGVPLEHFEKLFASLDLGERGAVSLREPDLSLVERYPQLPQSPDGAAVGKKVSQELLVILNAYPNEGTYTAVAPADNVLRTYSYRRIPEYPAYVIVGLAKEDYLAEWWIAALKTSLLIATFFFATFYFSRLIHRSWKRREAYVADLARQEKKFRTLLESAPDSLVIANKDGTIAMVNQQTEAMFGYEEKELLGQPVEVLIPERYRRNHSFLLRNYVSEPRRREMRTGRDLVAVDKSGREFPAVVSLAPLETEQGMMVTAAIRDVTERKAAEQRIEFLAYHDTLTGLPNRLLFEDRLKQAVVHADRSRTKVALLFVDLDKFKTVNDSLGHSAGDRLLKDVAARLRECVRETDTISRQGGDEFLIMLTNVPDADSITPILLKIMERLEAPCDIEGNQVSTTLSIGVAVYPDDGKDFETLLRHADTAMYRAKDAGRNTYLFFDEEMNREASEHLRLRVGLRRALEKGEFILHYQPQIRLSDGATIGVEALIRWNNPALGIVSPDRFIPAAEDSGLIVPIGEWVIQEACRQAAAWRAQGLPALTIAVNLSAVQFKRGNLERTVLEALERAGLAPSLLELELTESILIQDTESVLATVQRLKQLGVKLSIDDFGTGYSSLSYLKRLNVDKLKIDRSFVRDLASDPEDAAIVRAITQMARSLNLCTVAEGVEDEQALTLLMNCRCDEAQGYYFARPMPAMECGRYLRHYVASLPT